MTLRYVLRNFRRRKARSLLMLAALTVGVAILVALSAVVDTYRQFFAGTVAGSVGDFDLVITRPDTAPDPFLHPSELLTAVAAWRAKVEEGRLAAFHPGYAAYRAQAGFLWPRLRRPHAQRPR